MQRAAEHKGNVLKWLIFTRFKEQVVVAYLFQLINCHHPLENEITHRMSALWAAIEGSTSEKVSDTK